MTDKIRNRPHKHFYAFNQKLINFFKLLVVDH